MDLPFAVGSLKISIGSEVPVAAELLRPSDGDLRKAREDVVLEDLEDRVLGNLRRAECFLALLLDLVLTIGNRDVVSLR